MFCSRATRPFLLAIAALLLPLSYLAAQPQQPNSLQSNPGVTLRWGPRAGVSRYRLQVAADRDFTDIVFDRLVSGNQIQISDLPPGRYFWRIAPLTTELGEFSSAGIVVVQPRNVLSVPLGTPTPTLPIAAQSTTRNSIVTGGGWRAAIGDVGAPQLAHLRRSDHYDVVVTNNDGVTYALDSVTGVALWSVRIAPAPAILVTGAQPSRLPVQRQSASGTLALQSQAVVISEPLIVPSRSRLDDVVVVAGSSVVKLEGVTGRALWRTELPAFGCCAFALANPRTTNIVVVDASRQRLFFLNDANGAITAQIKLPGRVVGKPLTLEAPFRGAFVLAYDNGQIEVRDQAGTLLRSGSAASPALTGPILVRGRGGDLILVGARDGLTALTADTLQPLGRVALNNDMARGTLSAQDLDRDGFSEALMTTVRGHVVAVNASDGKIIWDVALRNGAGNLAFADVNRDGVTDVLTTDGPTLIALSGRDGSELWGASDASVIANHTVASANQSLVALPSDAGALLIATEPGRGGLRAIAFPNASVRPGNH